MKTWLFLTAGLLLLALVLWKSRERFEPEFLDRAQIARTVAVEYSSYDQTTNHMEPAEYSNGPIEGVETPFQVNQYRAYVK
jgi:hypothetical protein